MYSLGRTYSTSTRSRFDSLNSDGLSTRSFVEAMTPIAWES